MTEKDTVDLKPCPFCGSSDLRFCEYMTDGGPRENVECEDCNAQLGGWKKPGEAIAAWNQRSDIANARIAELEQVLATIRDHRKKCHEYDDDVGHPRREFDVEDMLLMETIARAALKDTPNG